MNLTLQQGETGGKQITNTKEIRNAVTSLVVQGLRLCAPNAGVFLARELDFA